jgi:hypothetical protein
VARMVSDLGLLLDHRRDAGQRPMVGVEPVDARTLAQRLFQIVELLVGQARASPVGPALRSASGPPARHRACQRLAFCRGHAELAGDLGLGAAGGKQLTGVWKFARR